jgi:hypothetical protein
MNRQPITAIRRAPRFSPNHIHNDTAIFSDVAEYLRNQGHDVLTYTEEEFLTLTQNPQRLFTMLRDHSSIQQLQHWEDQGCIAINSARSIQNCARERLTHLLLTHHIPCPDSFIVNSHDNILPLLYNKPHQACWLKRGDHHAIHPQDVSFARSPEEAQDILSEFKHRGIHRVVINEHLTGDLIKFYGVAGTPFFYWFYPFETRHSKFGFEKINGKAHKNPFNEELLRHLCYRTCEVLHLTIYGGDCIVSPDGAIHLIDFNDWPSFAPCRREAAPVIGDTILRAFQHPKPAIWPTPPPPK